MTSLRISLIQSDIFWEEPPKNREMFRQKIEALAGQTDLIILPEMFSTGFTMNVQQFAETMQGVTVSWLKEMAVHSKADMVGSVIIKEKENYYNRLIWAKPDGRILHYDKRHLFRMAGEDKVFSAGTARTIVALNGWKILPLICYDLRFPVWARSRQNEFVMIIYIANWPERRIAHWNLLLKARAVENQCYVAGVNRMGKDGQGVNHTGQSVLVDFLGNNLMEIDDEKMETGVLAYEGLQKFRKRFPVWKDADNFRIKNEKTAAESKKYKP